jgi:hypothetical protein
LEEDKKRKKGCDLNCFRPYSHPGDSWISSHILKYLWIVTLTPQVLSLSLTTHVKKISSPLQVLDLGSLMGHGCFENSQFQLGVSCLQRRLQCQVSKPKSSTHPSTWMNLQWWWFVILQKNLIPPWCMMHDASLNYSVLASKKRKEYIN